MPQNAAVGIHHSESDGYYHRKSTAIGWKPVELKGTGWGNDQ